MSGWWRGLGPGAQRLVQGAGFLAAVVFLVVFVDSAVPAENRLTPTLTTDREVEWDGMWRGVYVARGSLVARIVTDKSVYHLNENGYATIEYYNPGPGQVSFAPPTPVTMGFELDGVKLDRVMAAHISWMISSFELAPGETVTMITLHFRTPEAGRLTLTALGASETVLVLPTE